MRFNFCGALLCLSAVARAAADTVKTSKACYVANETVVVTFSCGSPQRGDSVVIVPAIQSGFRRGLWGEGRVVASKRICSTCWMPPTSGTLSISATTSPGCQYKALLLPSGCNDFSKAKAESQPFTISKRGGGCNQTSPSTPPTRAPVPFTARPNTYTTTRSPTMPPTLPPSTAKPNYYVLPVPPPTKPPTRSPTMQPTPPPTKPNYYVLPVPPPTILPTYLPTKSPSLPPTISPTPRPTPAPTFSTNKPTYYAVPVSPPSPPVVVTAKPVCSPIQPPTPKTPLPTFPPTHSPTHPPSSSPTRHPTYKPTHAPTEEPTNFPTPMPTIPPTVPPTFQPTRPPTPAPTIPPTLSPSTQPTAEVKVFTTSPTTSSTIALSTSSPTTGLNIYTPPSTSSPTAALNVYSPPSIPSPTTTTQPTAMNIYSPPSTPSPTIALNIYAPPSTTSPTIALNTYSPPPTPPTLPPNAYSGPVAPYVVLTPAPVVPTPPPIQPRDAPTAAPGTIDATLAARQEIRAILTQMMANDAYLPPKFVRMSFHDCVGGCDGCIDLQNPDNFGLDIPIAALDPIVRRYANNQTGLSRADIWIFAANVGIDMAKNRVAPTSQPMSFDLNWYGRVDCENANDVCKNAQGGDVPCTAIRGPHRNLPMANLNSAGILQFFADNFGFDARQTVTIMGAHTFGRLETKNSGFNGPNGWTIDNLSFHNEYYQALMGGGSPSNTYQEMIDYSPPWIRIFQNNTSVGRPSRHYWRLATAGKNLVMTNADLALVRNLTDSNLNPTTGEVNCGFNGNTVSGNTPVCPYAAGTIDIAAEFMDNNDVWMEEFKNTFEIMTTNGYVRNACSNPSICPLSTVVE